MKDASIVGRDIVGVEKKAFAYWQSVSTQSSGVEGVLTSLEAGDGRRDLDTSRQ